MIDVCITGCDNYDPSTIREIIARHFNLAGGIENILSRGDKVLLKPNLIAPRPVEQASLTNPAIIVETARLLIDFGVKVVVADSPAWSTAQHCIEVLGAAKELQKLNVEVRTFKKTAKVKIPYADMKVSISSDILESDAIINMPKIKAHQQMAATLAFKNMFGSVCGKKKAWWHYKRGESVEAFSELILGIYEATAPVYNILDGVIAMQGMGPLSGTPKQLGVIVSGQSAIACELLCTQILGYRQEDLPLIQCYNKHNSPVDFADLNILGDDYRTLICNDFEKAKIVPISFSPARIMRSISKQLLIGIKRTCSSKKMERNGNEGIDC